MAAELKCSNVLLPVYNTGSQFIRAYGGRSKLILTRKFFEHAKITGRWPRCTLCTAYLHTVYYMIRTLASTLAFFFLLVSSLSLSWTCCSLRRRRLRSFSFWLLERSGCWRLSSSEDSLSVKSNLIIKKWHGVENIFFENICSLL